MNQPDGPQRDTPIGDRSAGEVASSKSATFEPFAERKRAVSWKVARLQSVHFSRLPIVFIHVQGGSRRTLIQQFSHRMSTGTR